MSLHSVLLHFRITQCVIDIKEHTRGSVVAAPSTRGHAGGETDKATVSVTAHASYLSDIKGLCHIHSLRVVYGDLLQSN